MCVCVYPYALRMNEMHSFYKCARVCLYMSVRNYAYGHSLHMSIIYVYALLIDTYIYPYMDVLSVYCTSIIVFTSML